MKNLEVVFGHSLYKTMTESKLKENDILMFQTLFNVGDLSKVENYKIEIPKELYYDEANCIFQKEIKVIEESIQKKQKIRIWTSHTHIYSYLLFLYMCYFLSKKNYEFYVLYSDEYHQGCFSPSVMRENELEKLSELEHKVTKEEMLKNSKIWEQLVKENTELRIIENGMVKSVSLHYYDHWILETLKTLGTVSVSRLVATLLRDVNLIDSLYAYFIKCLIDDHKIKIVENNHRFFNSIIEIV